MVMIDKWTLIRLYTIQYHLDDCVEKMKMDLLRYGYLIKSCLPKEYQSSVLNIDYSFNKMEEPCVVLYLDKTNTDNILSAYEYMSLIEDIVGEDTVKIYEDTDTIIVLYVRI